MSIIASLLLLLSCLLGGLYLYVGAQIGATSVNAAVLLLLRGCVGIKHFAWSSGVRGLELQQPQRLGGVTVFSSDSLRLRRLGFSALLLRFSKPRFNFTADSSGLLHLVALLQDVGFFKEARAAKSPEVDKAAASLPADKPASKVHQAAFEGEAHVAFAHLTFRQGLIDLPYDIGQILGGSLKAVAAAGAANVRRCCKRIGGRHSDWGGQIPADTPGHLRYPFMLHLETENSTIDLAGWRCDTGFLLHQPIGVSVHFTQQMAQLALSRLHPLLAGAVRLQGKEAINCSLTPVEMHLPADMLSLRLQPLKLLLQTQSVVKGLVKLLHYLGLKDWQDPGTLEAWTSTINADVYRDSLIISKRMDMLLGHHASTGRGLHICMWGSVDAATNAVDMVMGLPASTLRRVGVATVDSAHVFQIPVRGKTLKPEIDWLRAGKDLAELVVKSRLREGLPSLGRIFKRRSKGSAEASEAPPLSEPLPWAGLRPADDSPLAA